MNKEQIQQLYLDLDKFIDENLNEQEQAEYRIPLLGVKAILYNKMNNIK